MATATTMLCPTCRADLCVGWSEALVWCPRCRHHFDRNFLRPRDETPCSGCGHRRAGHGPRWGLSWACSLSTCPCNEPKEKSMAHEPVRIQTNGVGADQNLYRFDNGYGASLVRGFGSYGLELAVIEWDGDSYELTYDTPITDDVIGHLDEADVIPLLDKIAALPPSRAIESSSRKAIGP